MDLAYESGNKVQFKKENGKTINLKVKLDFLL